jgi:hypothetical protein
MVASLGRIRALGLALGATVAVAGMVAAKPAEAHWHRGWGWGPGVAVGIGIAPFYYPGYVYAPPVYYAPPPVYYGYPRYYSSYGGAYATTHRSTTHHHVTHRATPPCTCKDPESNTGVPSGGGGTDRQANAPAQETQDSVY